MGPSCRCSGAAYSGVMRRISARVAVDPTSQASGSRSFAMPKSSSFTLPDRDTKMFDGLRSRWTTRARCACCTASHTTRNRRSRASSGRRWAAHHSVIGNAVDELHDQIRRPVGREAAVEQAGDVGMGQAGRAPVVRCESARWRRGRAGPIRRILTATSCRYWPSARSAR